MGSQAQVQGKMSEREKIERHKLKICGNISDKQKSEISQNIAKGTTDPRVEFILPK